MPDLRSVLRWAWGVVVCGLALGAVARIARWPVGRVAQSSELRLALRSASARVEICRDRTPEELAALAAHLRSLRICTETPVDYRLRVSIDGRSRLDRVVRHRGVRRTRPLAVDEAIAVEPGSFGVEIRFDPEVATPVESLPDLAALRLSTRIEFRAGRARLVRIAEHGDLELVAAPDSETAMPATR